MGPLMEAITNPAGIALASLALGLPGMKDLESEFYPVIAVCGSVVVASALGLYVLSGTLDLATSTDADRGAKAALLEQVRVSSLALF
jgi:hypothetical protein